MKKTSERKKTGSVRSLVKPTGRRDKNHSVLDAALGYAIRGWYVLPVYGIDKYGNCTCGGKANCKPGKHPMLSNWQTRASKSLNTLTKWWTQSPDANIGICCGKSRLVVIDVDPKNSGDQTFTQVLKDFPEVGKTLTAKSGSGGRHYYFTVLRGISVKNDTGTKLGPGIDIRADGGLIIAPPSKHLSGGTYAWLRPHKQLLELGQGLTKRLTTSPRKLPATEAVELEGDNRHEAYAAVLVPKGARHSLNMSITGKLRQLGIGDSTIRAFLVWFGCQFFEKSTDFDQETDVGKILHYHNEPAFDPIEVLHDWYASLKGNELRVLVAYITENICSNIRTPSVKRIMEVSGLSESAVYLARSGLETAGAVAVTPGSPKQTAKVKFRRRPPE